MGKPSDYGHRSYIPLIGNTKEWFKRDIETIKNSTKITIKKIPQIISITFLLVGIVYFLVTFRFNLYEVLIYFIIFSPISILGYFLLHVVKTKGYDVSGETGMGA